MFKSSFFVFLVLLLNGLGVLAKPAFIKRAPSAALLAGLNTNAKRFAAGLPPLPPKRRSPTRTGTAKRQTTSQTTFTGSIRVKRTGGDNVGYISKSMVSGAFTLTTAASNANKFQASLPLTGPANQLNIFDLDHSRYLAAIENPASPVATESNTFAYLGLSDATSSGATPQSGKNPSGHSSYNSETAIWSRTGLTQGTVQYITSTGASPPTTIIYDPSVGMFYVTVSPNYVIEKHAGSYAVEFYFA